MHCLERGILAGCDVKFRLHYFIVSVPQDRRNEVGKRLLGGMLN